MNANYKKITRKVLPKMERGKKSKQKRKFKHDKDMKNKEFKILQCAPKKTSQKTTTCYENDVLFQMKNVWNKYNKKKITTSNPYNIWLFLKNNFDNSCNNELCWLKYKKFQEEINLNNVKDQFRPIAPKKWKQNFYEWLSNLDIIAVMRQYEKEYNNFVFVGPSSIDFDNKINFGICVYEQLCKFDLQKYYNKGKNKIGIIFNLDYHYNSGTHWVALFVDLDKDFIFYFDSNGDNIPKRIQVLIDRIVEQGHHIQKNLKVMSNKGIEHQKKDGSCGMYTLVFVLNLLQELREPDFFIKYKVSDEEVQKHRKIYFNFDV